MHFLPGPIKSKYDISDGEANVKQQGTSCISEFSLVRKAGIGIVAAMSVRVNDLRTQHVLCGTTDRRPAIANYSA